MILKTAAVLTVSDSSFQRKREDTSGPAVVRRLEGGGLTLEESLKLWERGERLAAICLQWLEGARARLAAARPAQDEPADPAAPF